MICLTNHKYWFYYEAICVTKYTKFVQVLERPKRSVMVMWLLLLFVLGTHSQQYVKLPAANPKSGPVLTLHNFTTSTGAEGSCTFFL